MDVDFSPLDAYLDENDLDGYAFHDDDSNSDLYYTTGFGAPDPFFAVYTPEQTAILVSSLEYGRAKKESRADVVKRNAEYGLREKREEYGEDRVKQKVVAEFLADVGVESVATQFGFPSGLADGLREEGVAVEPESSQQSTVMDVRAVKTDEELEHVRDAQKANEKAMAAAEVLIRDANVEEGVLHYEGDVLTSERVTEEIEVALIREGCALDETIVACGVDAADPHDRGSGPLEAGETIIVDIFPRSKASKYHADMTRTFVKGDATETQREWHAVTDEARKAALDVVEAGVTGEEVNQAVVDVYQDHRHPTIFTDAETETGFIHSTGHGVGLDVHESPSISRNGGELKPGHVITIEPGLYDPDVGGVRIEDIVVVAEDGYENLTDYPIELEVE
jgi:Xaa-Pro aminopeptidase